MWPFWKVSRWITTSRCCRPLSEGVSLVFLCICGTVLQAVTCIYRRYPKKKKKEPWCCPDLWVILMAVRDIGCLFPRSPEGGRQGGVRAAGSFICDGKSPCHIDSRLGVASAATWALYQTAVPQRRAEPGGRGFSIYESINIQTLTYGHEIWVVTVRIRLLKRDFSWESLPDSVWEKWPGARTSRGKSKSNRRPPTPARWPGWVSD